MLYVLWDARHCLITVPFPLALIFGDWVMENRTKKISDPVLGSMLHDKTLLTDLSFNAAHSQFQNLNAF